MNRERSADDYFAKVTHWREEVTCLREILLATDLEETVKWGGPCYTINGKNVVGVGSFKSYFGLWFHQGVLLADENNFLVNAQEGKTKALRQWRMTASKDIKPRIIRRYLTEAIKNARQGKAIRPDRAKPLVLPPELKVALGKNIRARDSFKDLKMGSRREYADYIAEAKRDTTKQRRIAKILPMITSGKGLNDKYR